MGCRSDLFSTYSIVARDPQTGEIGGAVQTHQMCVGSIVLWMLPGRGALATQSLVNIGYGPITLAMLREAWPGAHHHRAGRLGCRRTPPPDGAG